MNDMTFEYDCNTPLETYEWDRMWLQHTENRTAPRVLYIGDSISVATLSLVNKMAANAFLVDGYHTSKALDNPFFRSTLACIAAQEGHRELILLNNGLHGWHLDDDSEYLPLLRDTVLWLQKNFPQTPLAMVLTTYINRGEREARAARRAALARQVAEEMRLPVIDFYTYSLENKELLGADGVHWQPAGYEKLATLLTESVKKLLEI